MDTAVGLTELERRVMEMLLAGDHPMLETLRQQFQHANVAKREYTGVGFFTHFEVPADVRRLPNNRSFELRDVFGASPDGPQREFGFILFIRDGVIDFLEGFTFYDRFPQPETVDANKITLEYSEGAQRDWDRLYKVLEAKA